MNFAERAIAYFSNLNDPKHLSDDISTMNPYKNHEVKIVVDSFYKRFYNDTNKRIFIFGINPGRFGGGLTGISFTDPVALRMQCGIENQLGSQNELSSKFIYKAIEKFGGVQKFFSSFFLTALYPLALIKNCKNINFYDSKEIFNSLKDEILQSVKEQINFGAHKKVVICLGKKNASYLSEINSELKYFEEIKILEHPRYIMQYKMKMLNYYLDEYINTLNECINLISLQED